MKFTAMPTPASVAATALLLLAGGGDAAILRGVVGRWQRMLRLEGGTNFGNKDCQCIGLDDVAGQTVVTLGEKEVYYPAGLGASCKAWDDNLNPECKGEEQPGWCKEKWCYVDIRDCHIPVLPKMAPAETAYMPAARFQNMALHYSYATCGAKDTWAKEIPETGKAGCRCIGFDKSLGTTGAKAEGKEFEYPAEVGGVCNAWDADRFPGCEGKDAPEWCSKKWCFVDPCACDLEVSPKETTVLDEAATFQGRPIFYSYATCGEKDSYSSKKNVEASKEQAKEVCSSQKLKKGFGDEKCPCIGFNGIQGDTLVTLGKKEVKFPADLGGRCEAWDADHHPDCKGEKGQEWCKEEWCYVDPRACDLAESPKLAPPETSYQPEARFQSLPLYYSYSTCGAKDIWAAETPNIGTLGCQCIGFDNALGNVLAKVDGKEVEYPAEVGGKCSAWDTGRYPGCEGTDAPDWCARKWCFVDPCSCKLEVPPKVSEILGEATFQGRPIFYSYATCGEKDSYSSEKHVKASKKRAAEVCADEKEEKGEKEEKKGDHGEADEQDEPKHDEKSPSSKELYNHSGYKNEWHNEWQHGDYPKWKGAK